MLSLRDIALRYQILLESVKSHEAQKLSAVVDKAQALFIEWAIGYGDGLLTDIKKKEFLSGLDTLGESLSSTYTLEAETLTKTLSSIADASSQFTFKWLTKMAQADTHLVKTTKAALKEAVFESPLSATGETATAMVDAFVFAQTQSVLMYASRSYANGNSIPEMVRGLVGTKKNNYKDGLTALNKRQAEAVARTTVQSAAHEAREQMFKDNDITEYEWVSTLDARTTSQCRSLDGRKFATGAGPVPPLHVNCRSTIVPVLGKEYDFLDKGATRSAEFGPVDADMTYYDWLKQQDATFQENVLGEERAKLFRDGGLTAERFAELNLNKDFQPRTLEEMRKLEPTAFSAAGI